MSNEGLLHSQLPPHTREMLLNLAAGDEQCETAWAHIVSCEMCQYIILMLGIFQTGNEEAIYSFVNRLSKYKRAKDPRWRWK